MSKDEAMMEIMQAVENGRVDAEVVLSIAREYMSAADVKVMCEAEEIDLDSTDPLVALSIMLNYMPATDVKFMCDAEGLLEDVTFDSFDADLDPTLILK